MPHRCVGRKTGEEERRGQLEDEEEDESRPCLGKASRINLIRHSPYATAGMETINQKPIEEGEHNGHERREGIILHFTKLWHFGGRGRRGQRNWQPFPGFEEGESTVCAENWKNFIENGFIEKFLFLQ